MKTAFLQFIVLILLTICSRDADLFYDELNAPLGLKIETANGGYLVSFYGENREKNSFKQYALFDGVSQEESRAKYLLNDAIYKIEIDPNRDVDIPIQIQFGGTDPGSSDINYEATPLVSGNYLTARALPEYPGDKIDNTDPKKGVTPSLPSNTVLIP